MPVTYHSVLVAVDGSEQAKVAFDKAVDITLRNEGASLTIVHVVDNRTYSQLEVYNLVIDQANQEANELINDYESRAKARGVANVKKILESGSPPTTISKTIASSVNADLIICGATGINAFERLFIGSVSENIVRYAKCDVLIVRA